MTAVKTASDDQGRTNGRAAKKVGAKRAGRLLLILLSLATALFLGGGLYVAWELIPPYFHNYEFQDDLDDIARVNSYGHKTDDDIKDLVIQKAAELEVTLKEDAISVSRSTDGMGISVRYSVHLKLFLYPIDLHFAATSRNGRI